MISFGKTWGRGLEEIVVIFYSEENSALHLKKKSYISFYQIFNVVKYFDKFYMYMYLKPKW